MLGGPAVAKLGGDIGGGKSAKKAFGEFTDKITGKVKEMDSTPSDIQPLREALVQQLLQGLNGNALAQGFQGVLGQGGPPPAQDTSFFYNNILGPYNQLFDAQRGQALAQAKESAGNLTGSGYNNILGQATAESLGQQQALSAQTLLGLRGQELQRQRDFLHMLFGFGTAGVGPSQPYYQPGYLDTIGPLIGMGVGRGAAR
jgi:hypothetical protein